MDEAKSPIWPHDRSSTLSGGSVPTIIQSEVQPEFIGSSGFVTDA